MNQSLNRSQRIYFLGIGGTGMAAVAGLLKEDGYRITGSDKGVYPPMSEVLAAAGINVMTPYDAKHIAEAKPELVVVANSISRGHVELEAVLTAGIPVTSFPEILKQLYLEDANSIVVTGTHGKTTTTSLVSHLLTELGEKPGFLVGGLPKNFSRSFHLGDGRHFVIEGDEYDTVYYDKGPKFLHYCPDYLLIGNVEYDHADIYQSVEQIYQRFEEVIGLTLKRQGQVIGNVDDPGVQLVLKRQGIHPGSLFSVGHRSNQMNADFKFSAELINGQTVMTIHCPAFLDRPVTMRSPLLGRHNQFNTAMALAAVMKMGIDGSIRRPRVEELQTALSAFSGVRRRLDLLLEGRIRIYEDFAHHPTAVDSIIDTVREHFPRNRLVIAFEPANASSRRNVFSPDYVKAFRKADLAYIGASVLDTRVPEKDRMDTGAIAAACGGNCRAFQTNEDLLQELRLQVRDGDIVVFMSSSSFSGIQHRLAAFFGAPADYGIHA